VLLSSVVLASVWPVEVTITDDPKEQMWIPTEEDIAYQDSMYTIIQSTQSDITDIKQDIVYIIERLDYEDGTHDSIRYVAGSQIDINRSKRN
jgi:hypothetical protein